MASDELLAGHRDVFTFNLLGSLAEDDPAAHAHNMLWAAYREGTDSHPSRAANETLGPLFADFVMEASEQHLVIRKTLSGVGNPAVIDA